MSRDFLGEFKFFIYPWTVLLIWIGMQSLFYTSKIFDVDTYFYMLYDKGKGLHPEGLIGQLLPWMIHIWGIVKYPIIMTTIVFILFLTLYYIFYLVSSSHKISFIILLMFSLDPLTWLNFRVGNIDKNLIVMCITALYILMNFKSAKKWDFIILSILFFLAPFAWSGFPIIYCIYLIYRENKFTVLNTILLCISGIGAIIFFNVTWFVMEMRPAIFLLSPIYFFYALVITVLYKQRYFHRMNNIKFASIIIGISFLLIFRMHPFFLLAFYIMLADSLQYIQIIPERLWIVAGFFVFCLFLSYPFYIQEDITHNFKDFAPVLLNEGSDCYFSDWGKGHIYAFYLFPKIVINKAHPTNIKEIESFYMNSTMTRNCTYFFNKADIDVYGKLPKIRTCYKDRWCIA